MGGCRAGTVEERIVGLQVFSLALRPAGGGTTLRMCGADCGGKDSQAQPFPPYKHWE